MGMSELILVGIVALLVFGPKKLPEISRSLGKCVREFRQAMEETETVEVEIRKEHPALPRKPVELTAKEDEHDGKQ